MYIILRFFVCLKVTNKIKFIAFKPESDQNGIKFEVMQKFFFKINPPLSFSGAYLFQALLRGAYERGGWFNS